MSRQLFGTDGIRGKAGEPPLDKATAFALGAALGHWAKGQSSEPKVLLGMDTRESGPWLAEAVAAGLVSSGVEPHFAGLLTANIHVTNANTADLRSWQGFGNAQLHDGLLCSTTLLLVTVLQIL